MDVVIKAPLLLYNNLH